MAQNRDFLGWCQTIFCQKNEKSGNEKNEKKFDPKYSFAILDFVAILKLCIYSGDKLSLYGVLKSPIFQIPEEKLIQIFKRSTTAEEVYALFPEVQEKINMTRDIRVIIINNELVLHYWRINNSQEWKVTSTSSGSSVDFDYIPTGLKEFTIKLTQDLNLTSAAYDITFKDDKVENAPIVLEVSPAFMPNPKPRSNFKNITYDAYKKKLFIYPNYSSDYVC
jgi:hypothetical protein